MYWRMWSVREVFVVGWVCGFVSLEVLVALIQCVAE